MAQQAVTAEPVGAGAGGRSQLSAGSARSLLLTVLGELVMPNANSVWTASLLYVLTRPGRRLIETGAERVLSMSSGAESWDGRWVIVLVSIPQSQRAVRKKLYGALSWEGFGNPTPGVWLSPHPGRQAGAQQIIDDLGLRESTLAFVGSLAPMGLREDEIVARAWDLDGVRAQYKQLIIRYS